MSKILPKVEESNKFNLFTSIWIVPFIAVIIAAWLAYQYFSQLGPEIRIVFPENEGLKAGQSHVKYRDVPIGVVKKIELEEDGAGVTVVIRMNKNTSTYLNENTKFWIVKPEVGITGISGLETLISGTYINMFPQSGEEFKDTFHGQNNAFRKISEGEYMQLSAPMGYNVKVGTPLYFKNMKAGKVEYMNISLDSKSIEFIVFIEKFYVPYVHTSSNFWVTSALDVDMSSGRLDINLAPLTHLLQGGISFSSTGEDMMETVPDGFVFHLYKNDAEAGENKVGQGGKAYKEFAIIVKDSVSKLKKDASVRYDGFDVGHVKEISLSYDGKSHKMLGKVLVEIDTSAFKDEKEDNVSGETNFYAALHEGLKAQFKSSNPLTGSLFVDLVFEETNTSTALAYLGSYPLLPTAEYHEAGVMDGVEKMIAKLNRLPLEKLFASLDMLVANAGTLVTNADEPLKDVLISLKTTVKNLNTMTNKKAFASMPDEINKSLKELTTTLKTTKKVVKGYGKNSLMTQQLAQTLKIVSRTSQEMQLFLRMLNRKPNSLIFGDR
jgi:paraquat-inducible protein B